MSIRHARQKGHKGKIHPFTHFNGDKSAHALDRLRERAAGDSHNFSAKILKRRVQRGEVTVIRVNEEKRKILIFKEEEYCYKVVMNKEMTTIITVCRDYKGGNNGKR